MRRLVLALGALIVLSACDRAPTPIEPTAKSSSSAASPADATSSLNPPELPAAAKRNDETGAANFVLYWVRAFNFAARTGDSEEMRRFAPRCKVCAGYADDFETMKPKDRATADAWSLSNVSVTRTDRGFDVDATVRASRESKEYPLTFVVRSSHPFQLEHIYQRP
jgi:hypothetical protein